MWTSLVGTARNAPETGCLWNQWLAAARAGAVRAVTKSCAGNGALSGKSCAVAAAPGRRGLRRLTRIGTAQEDAQSAVSLPEAVVHLPGVLLPVQPPVGRQAEGRRGAFAFRVDPGVGRQPAAFLQQHAGGRQQVLVERRVEK